MTLTPERVRELVSYNAETGVFNWRVSTTKRVRVGDVAGHVRLSGRRPYIQMCLDRHVIYGHRLAWVYVTGEWPDRSIDHINGDSLDNRFANLRLASCAENGWNRGKQSNNRSGYKGVSWHRTGQKFIAQIRRNGCHYHLGFYETAEEAHEAYKAAAEKLHGQFCRTITANPCRPGMVKGAQ